VHISLTGGTFGMLHSLRMADQHDFQLLALGLRRMGWVRFWIQTILGVVVIGVLLFNNVGSSLARNSERALGLGPGLSLTTLAFLVLLFGLWQGWLIVKTGRALDSSVRPSRGETSRLIKRGLIGDLLGLVFASVGYQSLAGALFVQASMQAPGISIGTGLRSMENYPITSLEMLSVLSNTQVLFAHVIGLIFSLWLLQRIYRVN
tara:strand:- start:87 stop:701 length:615 start_codon:yes stop_codon:yes gene_type:complete